MRLSFLCFYLLPGVFCAGSASATTVQGRVVDCAPQQPLAGAAVTLAAPGFFATLRIIATTTQTGADGRHAVETDRASFFALARAAGQAARVHQCRTPLGRGCVRRSSPG